MTSDWIREDTLHLCISCRLLLDAPNLITLQVIAFRWRIFQWF
jgi:hypothetical protein